MGQLYILQINLQMGNNSSEQQNPSKRLKSEAVDQPNQTITVEHPKFKNMSLQDNNQHIRILLPIQNQESYRKWQQLYSKLNFYEQDYLLLAKSCEFTKKGLCGESGIISIYYDDYHHLLKGELQNRLQNGYQYLSQPELWYIFYGLLTASQLFKTGINSKVGDIRPSNIFLNQIGMIKIANMCSWPNEKTNYQKSLLDRQITYLSPQQCNQCVLGNMQFDHDKFISQSFSIGVSMLEAATLESNQELYTFNSVRNSKQKNKKKGILRTDNNELLGFNEKLLFDKLKNLWLMNKKNNKNMNNQSHKQIDENLIINYNQQQNAGNYSWTLKVAISSLCEPNPKQRTSATQLYSWLKAYQTQIVNLRPFKIRANNSPQSYHNLLNENPNNLYAELPPIKNMNKYISIISRIENGQFGLESIHKLGTNSRSPSPRRNSPHQNSPILKQNTQIPIQNKGPMLNQYQGHQEYFQNGSNNMLGSFNPKSNNSSSLINSGSAMTFNGNKAIQNYDTSSNSHQQNINAYNMGPLVSSNPISQSIYTPASNNSYVNSHPHYGNTTHTSILTHNVFEHQPRISHQNYENSFKQKPEGQWKHHSPQINNRNNMSFSEMSSIRQNSFGRDQQSYEYDFLRKIDEQIAKSRQTFY